MEQSVPLAFESDFIAWRAWTRYFLYNKIPAQSVHWHISPPDDLFSSRVTRQLPEAPVTFTLSHAILDIFQAVVASGVPERFSLLHHYLEASHTSSNASSEETPLYQKIYALATSTRRNAIMLRQCLPPNNEQEPVVKHLTVPAALLESQAHALQSLRPFPWLLRTPGRIILSEKGHILFAADAPDDIQADDTALLDYARQYGQSAQYNAYWQSITRLSIRPKPAFIQQASSLKTLRAYAVDCKLCPLCHAAQRTVFGEGNPEASLLFVGEQPGDYEDQKGRPFIGPAGQLFDQALQEAGGERCQAWVSNAVKHFRFFSRNGRRIHQKPDLEHIQACAPWLAAERALLRPKVTVMLGATGATALLNRPVRVFRERSRLFHLPDGSTGLITVHPSFLLRQENEENRTREYQNFVSDLKLALSALA